MDTKRIAVCCALHPDVAPDELLEQLHQIELSLSEAPLAVRLPPWRMRRVYIGHLRHWRLRRARDDDPGSLAGPPFLIFLTTNTWLATAA